MYTVPEFLGVDALSWRVGECYEMPKIHALKTLADFDPIVLRRALQDIPVVAARSLNNLSFDVSAAKKMSEDAVVNRVKRWIRSDFPKTAAWSKKERIPFRFRYGVLPEEDGVVCAGVEVKIGSNGGTYYGRSFCRVETDKYVELE